jgi:hypothetical protein
LAVVASWEVDTFAPIPLGLESHKSESILQQTLVGAKLGIDQMRSLTQVVEKEEEDEEEVRRMMTTKSHLVDHPS